MRSAASFVVVIGLLGSCAALRPPVSHERCARARLARQWQAATPDAFVGCYVDDAGALLGTLVLSDIEDEASYDDEPRRFRVWIREVTPRHGSRADADDDGARWELLEPALIRLRFPAPPGRPQDRPLEAVDACLEDDRGAPPPLYRLSGPIAAVTAQAPFVGPSSPVRLRRVPCTSIQ
jgi:hypothetical protein